MRFARCLDAMEEWYIYHHGGCDETDCTMAECENQGLCAWASKLLVDAIGIDVKNSNSYEIEEKADRAYKRLTTKYNKQWTELCDSECEELLKTEHVECEKCNAITWQPSLYNWECTCGNKLNG